MADVVVVEGGRMGQRRRPNFAAVLAACLAALVVAHAIFHHFANNYATCDSGAVGGQSWNQWLVADARGPPPPM